MAEGYVETLPKGQAALGIVAGKGVITLSSRMARGNTSFVGPDLQGSTPSLLHSPLLLAGQAPNPCLRYGCY